MSVEDIYARLLRAANLEGDDAAIRIAASYDPIGGTGTKVFPPTYPHPTIKKQSSYLTEDRYLDGELTPTVLLDSTQSEANRCEAALQLAIAAGELALPHLVLEVDAADTRMSISSLDAPHRSRDAYFRDAVTTDAARTKFDDTPAGAALAAATDRAALAYYRHAPADLVFGTWDSHRGKRRATRFARVYTSEIIGIRPEGGTRGAGRMDPAVLPGTDRVTPGSEASDWVATDKGKKKLSEIGHGMIPPSLNITAEGERTAGGGVAVSAIRRIGVLGFAATARLPLVTAEEVPTPDAQRAGRAVLAALALLGDRLAFARPGLFLRSGCELILTDESLMWVGRGGETPLDLDVAAARDLFDLAVRKADEAGLTWDAEPLSLVPADNLQGMFERTFSMVDLDAED